jgi:hypothetical protein
VCQHGVAGEDEGAAGAARGRREEVEKARGAAVAVREGRLEEEGLVGGDGEVELREDHRSEEGDADGVGKGRGGVKESAFLA